MWINSSDPVVRQGLGKQLAPRPDHENPKSRKCPLHLQRVCGTCAHYGGPLHPAKGEPSSAPCAALAIQVGHTRNAWDCRRWTRKVEGQG